MTRSLASLFTTVTMYRLMLYYLITLVVAATLLSLMGILPYNPLTILVQCIYLVALSYLSNQIFATFFRVKPNVESQFITGLILSLIIGPVALMSNFLLLTLAPIAAMLSKYMFAWQKRHIFNPATFGVITTAVILGESASWWGGSRPLLPIILLGGIVIGAKLRRFHLITSFIVTYVLLSLILARMTGNVSTTPINDITSIFLDTPLLFFSFIMLIEPLTSPTDRMYRIYFGIFTAFILLVYQLTLNVPYTLELALLSGNIFTRLLRFDPRIILRLKAKKDVAAHTKSFYFEPLGTITHTAGQFLEWSLPHPSPDSRGVRRFFTIASSPTEPGIMLTTKFADKSSSFKSALEAMKVGDELSVSQLEGEFVLPKDKAKKLVFIAGGIGITPFHSMIKYLIDTGERRDIVLFYSNRTPDDIVFKDILETATQAVGLQIIYTITDDIPKNWEGQTGFIDAKMIAKEVPDYKDRMFYISGPEPMVEAFEKMIAQMGIAQNCIKRDFFPGYTDTHQAQKK